MTTPDSGADPDETAAIRAIADMLVASIRRDYPPGTLARRDAHPKHHAIVRAEFRVEDDVPEPLRHGLFATPHVYPAWIRFSNGSPKVRPDRRRDQRGMAIKLVGVPGAKVLEAERNATSQDFVLASAPRFFIRNVRDYVGFTRAATRKPAVRLLSYFFAGAPWQWKVHEFRALVQSLGRAHDLLALRYWSQTAYRLGPHAVKYSARPVEAAAAATPRARRPANDFLREALTARLLERPAEFAFLVQRQTDEATMPIEDPTIEWDEGRAPFARVATITIPAQRFDSPAQMTLAEQIAFTPWHTLPDHEPLGGVNRTRRIVYETVSAERHKLNGTTRREPESLALEDWLATTGATGATPAPFRKDAR